MQTRTFLILWMFSSLFCISSSLFAEIICPKCHYKNENSDRYCLNCQFEIRTLSEEEKQSMETLNLQRSRKTLNSLQQESQKQKQRKQEGVPEVSVILPPLNAFEEIPLYIDRRLVKLGMTKQKIRNMLDLHKSLKEDIWDISSGNGIQDSYLYFTENLLVKWEKHVYCDYFIQRNYPLNPQALKIGMSEQELRSLWGEPDFKFESCSSSDYQLKISYYLKEPHSETQYAQMNSRTPLQNRIVIKEGLLAEIIFDSQKKILNITVREGALRQGNYSPERDSAL